MSYLSSSIKKVAMFTDIHWGRRSNSRVHNQDCLDYIDWFIAQVKDQGYSHIVFLGDWFESRSAINIETMELSRQGICKLDKLNIPIIFIVGNHDLHRRTTRDIHSVKFFDELKNLTVVDKPTVIDEMLFCPFMFEEEYPALIEHLDKQAWFGHFEFKGFVLTGHSRLAEHGPDPKLFAGPKKIFSGHFHKRQSSDNIVYIGNVFPADFGDAGDYERGMCTYYVQEDKVTFTNWSDCPKYYKTTLSKVIAEEWQPLPKMKVKCVIDIELGYQEAQELREAMTSAYDLRDFVLEEDREAKQGLLEGDNCKVEETLLDFGSIDELVISQLQTVKEDKKYKIDGALLVEIYKSLPAEATEAEQV
jgi:DNA repair exonuclease SbcCD nuclease subunit